ncbi:MAG: YceI family protein [Phycisphaerales bacterium]
MKKQLIAGIALGTAGLVGLAGWGTSEAAYAETEAASQAETYTVDNVHSFVIFKVRHVGAANFYGRFNNLDGTVGFENGQITSADITVEAESVDTGNRGRDDHLRNADFFNTRQYPEITFSGTSTDGETLTGELTLHGVTRDVTATIHDVGTGEMRGTAKMGFEARFTIKRSDFDMRGYLADDLSDNGPLGNTVELIVAIEGNG